MRNVIKNIKDGFEEYESENSLVPCLLIAGMFFLLILVGIPFVVFIKMQISWEIARFMLVIISAACACFYPLYQRGKSLNQGDT